MLDDSCVRRRRGVQADASKHEELSSTTGKRTKKAEPTSWVRQILVLGAPVLAFVAAALLARQLARPTPLGEVYALCSRDGRGIYTVDESLPTVQCIGVNGTTIFDRGRLSTHSYSSGTQSVAKPDDVSGDIRSRWATENQGQLDVRMIEHGSVVLPGLSGRSLIFSQRITVLTSYRLACAYPGVRCQPCNPVEPSARREGCVLHLARQPP
jgi:hypothetical protein